MGGRIGSMVRGIGEGVRGEVRRVGVDTAVVVLVIVRAAGEVEVGSVEVEDVVRDVVRDVVGVVGDVEVWEGEVRVVRMLRRRLHRRLQRVVGSGKADLPLCSPDEEEVCCIIPSRRTHTWDVPVSRGVYCRRGVRVSTWLPRVRAPSLLFLCSPVHFECHTNLTCRRATGRLQATM